MKNTILKNKKFIVSIIVLLIAVFGFAGYKFYINSKAVDGIKEYKIIVTDSDKTFSEEFDVTTKEKSLGEDDVMINDGDTVEFILTTGW